MSLEINRPEDIVGMWILFVENTGAVNVKTDDGLIPMLAESGDSHRFLLGFKDAHSARKFVDASNYDGVQPRMVMKSNYQSVLGIAQQAGAAGILIDFDPKTKEYASAAIMPE